MQFQIVNLKTIFISLLWLIVASCAVTSFYYTSYVQTFGYTDLKFWIDMAFYSAMMFTALLVVTGFSKRKTRKRFYKKQQEILNLCTETNSSISLNQILSKASFSKAETKGVLEHLVEKNILIPSFSEEQELVYRTTNETDLEKYLMKIH